MLDDEGGAVPDHSCATVEDVQHLGQSPDEIGARIAELMRRKAEASRVLLECDFEAAKLLAIMQDQHGYKGKRYAQFALAHGVATRTDAYDLLELNEAGEEVLAPPEATTDPYYEYPSWRQVWRSIKDRDKARDSYWLTPPALYAELDAEFLFDHDPFPCPLPEGFDALIQEWGLRNYVNLPFRADDVVGGTGPTAGVRKAIEQQQKGKLSAIVLPVPDYVIRLLEAGAEIRPLGRIKFLDVVTHRPAPHPPCVALFILRPQPSAANDNHLPSDKQENLHE